MFLHVFGSYKSKTIFLAHLNLGKIKFMYKSREFVNMILQLYYFSIIPKIILNTIIFPKVYFPINHILILINILIVAWGCCEAEE